MADFNPYSDSVAILFDNGDIILERQIQKKINNTIVHTVKEGETIQSIAFQYYGDSGYWVYICDINNIFNPFVELEEGMQIYIPSI
jgi:hypothetical protein